MLPQHCPGHWFMEFISQINSWCHFKGNMLKRWIRSWMTGNSWTSNHKLTLSLDSNIAYLKWFVIRYCLLCTCVTCYGKTAGSFLLPGASTSFLSNTQLELGTSLCILETKQERMGLRRNESKRHSFLPYVLQRHFGNGDLALWHSSPAFNTTDNWLFPCCRQPYFPLSKEHLFLTHIQMISKVGDLLIYF